MKNQWLSAFIRDAIFYVQRNILSLFGILLHKVTSEVELQQWLRQAVAAIGPIKIQEKTSQNTRCPIKEDEPMPSGPVWSRAILTCHNATYSVLGPIRCDGVRVHKNRGGGCATTSNSRRSRWRPSKWYSFSRQQKRYITTIYSFRTSNKRTPAMSAE